MSSEVKRTNMAGDWKTHPIYFVGIGFGFGVVFAMTWLAPAQLGNLRYEVEDARRIEAEASGYKQKIANLEGKLEQAKELVLEARGAGLFRYGSPYPAGFGKARVGDPLSAVEQNYSSWLSERSERNWVVDSADHLFL